MPEHTSEQLLAAFDRCPLHARYWTIFGLVSAVAALDFFDFFSVGFLVAKCCTDRRYDDRLTDRGKFVHSARLARRCRSRRDPRPLRRAGDIRDPRVGAMACCEGTVRGGAKDCGGAVAPAIIGGAVANDQARRPADREPGGALRPAGDLLADTLPPTSIRHSSPGSRSSSCC
jgi:hypothetical protein